MTLNIAFKALNDKTRREILELLRDKDMTAGEIVEKFNMSGPSISHHLELLKRAGFIESEKVGQYVKYSLNMTVMDDILKWIVRFSKKKQYK